MSKNLKKKTLIINEGVYQEFLVYVDEAKEWGTCGTPYLYPITATMESLKEFYPNDDFTNVRMVEVDIKINE